MMNPADRPLGSSKPLSFLISFTAIYSIGLAIPAAYAVIPVLDRAQFLWTPIFVLIVIWWMNTDRYLRGLGVPYEFEAFAFFASPIVVPYYLYRTRGAPRGLLLVLSIAGLYWLPYLISSLVYTVRIIGFPR
jgi:hypothetical protein